MDELIRDRMCDSMGCVSCGKFEQHVSVISSVEILRAMRRSIINSPVAVHGTKMEELSSWVANHLVFTGGFFILCNMVAFTPLVWQSETVFRVVNWLSSNWWQLTLLPLIGIAGARQERLNNFRDERQYRILLIGERLDELKEDT